MLVPPKPGSISLGTARRAGEGVREDMVEAAGVLAVDCVAVGVKVWVTTTVDVTVVPGVGVDDE